MFPQSLRFLRLKLPGESFLGVPSFASRLRDDSWPSGKGSEGSAEAKPPHSPHFQPNEPLPCHPDRREGSPLHFRLTFKPSTSREVFPKSRFLLSQNVRPIAGSSTFYRSIIQKFVIPSIEIKKPLPHEIQFITYAPCSPLSNLERELGERQRNPLQFGGWVGGEAKKSSPIWRMGWGRGQKCHLTKHQFFRNVAKASIYAS